MCVGADTSALDDAQADGTIPDERGGRLISFPFTVPEPMTAAINGSPAGIGLVDRVCAGHSAPDGLGHTPTTSPPTARRRAMATVKRQILRHATMSLDDTYAESEAWTVKFLKGSDFADGLASYVERRPPSYAPLGEATAIPSGARLFSDNPTIELDVDVEFT